MGVSGVGFREVFVVSSFKLLEPGLIDPNDGLSQQSCLLPL